MQFLHGGSVRYMNARMIAVFCAVTGVVAVAAGAMIVPDQALMVLLAPIFLAALRPQRYVYTTMLFFLMVCAIIVTETYRLPVSDSTLTVFATFSTTFLACEAIRFAAKRQALMSTRVKESEQRLRAFLENAPDSIFVVDQRGCINEVNDAVRRTFGYERDDLIGAMFDKLCVDEYPVRFGIDLGPEWSGQLRRADGTTLTVEMTMGEFEFQRATSCVVIVRDVEERTLADAKLSHSEAIRKTIVDSTPDYITMIDNEYRILFINRTLPDYTPESVIGFNLLEFSVPGEREEMRGCLERVRQTQATETIETTLVSKENSEVNYFSSRVAPVLESGEVAAFILIATDVTDQRIQEAERIEFERSMLQSQHLESLGLLAGGIAHDFNNLLVAIMGRADLAHGDVGNPELVRRHLEEITEASQHAAGLCKQLLAYSGKGRFLVAPTDVSRLVNETRKLLEISAPDNVQIEYELTESPFVVEADSTQIKQVLMNLVTNAAEALQPSGGTIRIRSGVEELDQAELLKHMRGEQLDAGSYAYLEVEDTGSGMTAETMERLFNPFFTTKSEGTGLGMAAVLGIVRGHHGAMSVTSKEELGTTIRVILPAQFSAHKNAGTTKGAGKQPFENSGTILVVDDEPAVRAVAQAILERAKFSVVTADTGHEAIEIIGENNNSIIAVVLDMKMPDMDGEQVMQQLRAIRPSLPILLSSGYSETEVSERVEGNGVSAFLPKPYLAADLVGAVNGVLSPAS